MLRSSRQERPKFLLAADARWAIASVCSQRLILNVNSIPMLTQEFLPDYYVQSFLNTCKNTFTLQSYFPVRMN